MKGLPLVVALLVAGCLAPPAEDLAAASVPSAAAAFVPPVPDFDFTTVVDPDHGGHQLPLMHDAGHGLGLTGFTAIQPSLPKGMRGSITQVDVWGGYAVVAGMEGGLAFAIVDIQDPAAPKVVSHVPSAANGWTARFTDDGAYVFYGCQVLGGPYVAATTVTGTQLPGRCDDPSTPDPMRKGGVVVYDVRDKAAPEFVAFVETTAAHNLFVASVGGFDYAFTNGVDIVRFDRASGALEVVANVPGVHDASIARHPLSGDLLLFTGTDELAIWNVNDPANPEPVFEGGIEGVVGWHEQTLVPGVVDGRVVLVLAGETFTPVRSEEPTAVVDVLYFADVTDPANPTKLGEWSAPWDPQTPWVSYVYSIHEVAASPTGQVAVAWYHGGVWVVDVSTKERQAQPVAVAAYQPNHAITATPSTFFQTAVPVVPFVWGVGWDARGYLVVPDMHTGLYVLEPDYGLVPALDGGQ